MTFKRKLKKWLNKVNRKIPRKKLSAVDAFPMRWIN